VGGGCILPGVLTMGCSELLNTNAYEVGSHENKSSCPPEQIPDDLGVCTAVGVGICLPSADGNKEPCVPVVGTASCALGEMMLPGSTECRTVGTSTCPTNPDPATWGEKIDSSAVYVFGGYAGTLSDGSVQKPWKTIQDAIDNVGNASLIVVAPGIYEENIVMMKPLVVMGACASQTEIRGIKSEYATINLTKQATSTLSELHVTGPGRGIENFGANVILKDLWISQTGGEGMVARAVTATGVPVMRIEHSLVEQSTGAGIVGYGYDLTVDQSEVRYVSDSAREMGFGSGIVIHPNEWLPALSTSDVAKRSRLVVGKSWIHDTSWAGILFEGANGAVTQSVISDTKESAQATSMGANVQGAGIVIRQELGRGITNSESEPVIVSETMVERALGVGIRVAFAHARLDSTLVRSTLAHSPAPCEGHGLRLVSTAERPASLSINHSVIEDSYQTGIHNLGGTLTMDSSIVRATHVDACSGQSFGDGIGIYSQPSQPIQGSQPASLNLHRTLIEGNERAGIAGFQALVTLDVSHLQNNSMDLLSASYLDEVSTSVFPTIFDGKDSCVNLNNQQTCAVTQSDLAPAWGAKDGQGNSVATIKLSGMLKETGSLLRIPDANVWLWGRDDVPATGSDTTGGWQLTLVPASSSISLVMARTQFIPVIRTVQTKQSNIGNVQQGLTSLAAFSVQSGMTGIQPFSYAKSSVYVEIDGPAGKTVQASPDPQGLWFYVVDGSLVPSTKQAFTTKPDNSALLLQAHPDKVTLSLTTMFQMPVDCSNVYEDYALGLGSETTKITLPLFPGVVNVTRFRCKN
jgi:hypothetical protein